MAVLERVEVSEQRLANPQIVRNPWFTTLPVVAQLRRDGLDLDHRVTVVVGENGTGKSTFVEAVAAGWLAGLTAQVGHWAPSVAAEDSELGRTLVLHGERPRPHGGCFLRAEAMHGLFTTLDAGEGQFAGESRAFGGELNSRSHGESFLAFLESRLTERGLFIMDEPEAALSFTSCLRLLSIMGMLVDNGSQVLLATHSPLLAAFPGATILEFGAEGYRRAEWGELESVDHWRTFLGDPELYLRYLFTDEPAQHRP